jgi:uncharacterized membrane-anchored protein YhcB (DUF1043 family)
MLAWSTTEWAIAILIFLAGMFIGMMFLAGGKWKRRYKDEARLRQEEIRLRQDDIKRREELEAAQKHHEAELIAARARSDTPPPLPPKTTRR